MTYQYECNVCTGGCIAIVYTLDNNPKPINCLLHNSDFYSPNWKPKDNKTSKDDK